MLENNNSQSSSICQKTLNLKKASQCPFKHGVNGFNAVGVAETLKVVLIFIRTDFNSAGQMLLLCKMKL